MQCRFEITWLLLAALGVSPTSNGQTWTEVGDAAELPGTAQRTRGAGPLEFIQGTIASDDLVDVYCIRISDPAGFSAWTDERNGGAAEFDTMLWLFNEDGIGVLANDDNPGGTPFHSGVLPPSDDGLTSGQMAGDGVYYLAVSRYQFAPYSPAGPIFQRASREEVSGPDGSGGGAPISHWSEEGVGGDAPTGEYSVRLSGAETCPPCHLGLPYWDTAGSGTSGSIYALHAFDDGTGNYLFAGGDFDLAGGTTVNNVVSWNGTSWSALENGVDGVVNAMAVFGDELLIGGDFIIGDPVPQPCNPISQRDRRSVPTDVASSARCNGR